MDQRERDKIDRDMRIGDAVAEIFLAICVAAGLALALYMR